MRKRHYSSDVLILVIVIKMVVYPRIRITGCTEARLFTFFSRLAQAEKPIKTKGFCCSCNLFFLPSLFFIHLCHDHGIVSMSAPQPDQLLHGLPVYLEILLHCLEAAPGVCPRLLVSKPAVTPGDHGLAPCLPQHRGPLRVTWGKLS